MNPSTFWSTPFGRVARAVPAAAGLALAAVLVPAGIASASPAALPANCTPSGQTVTCTFAYTGGLQTWTAPAGVTTATVTLDGAQGGPSSRWGGSQPGGNGATVTATIPVTPGDTYSVTVGGMGDGEYGGFNGGGLGGATAGANVLAGGGGGATDFALNPENSVVAGGGGGGGATGFNSSALGGDGGPSAGPGANGQTETENFGQQGTGGGGGEPGPFLGTTGGAGGTPGTGFINGVPGAPGTLGQGGHGVPLFDDPEEPGGPGGGGGGGFTGGGGGGQGGTGGILYDGVGAGGGGGGGGSDFVPPQATSSTVTDGVWTGNGQATITYTVPATTTTTVAQSANPSVVGQAVTYTATVSPAPDGGTVAFTDGTTTMGGCGAQQVDTSTGTATCTVTYTSPGAHSVTATYNGDANFSASSDSLTQTVNQAATSTTVASSANPSAVGQSVTLTATVSVNPPGAGTPTGTVTFADGSTSLGTATLGGGTATLTTSALAAGSHAITGTYSGDANFTGSGGSLTQAVNYSFTGFLAPVDNPPTVNVVTAGQSIPIQFSLGGNFGLGIIAAGYPAVQQVSCATGATVNTSTETDTAGSSGLQYNATTNTYTYVWKTSKAAKGTCQVFSLGLNDGTVYTANFQYAN